MTLEREKHVVPAMILRIFCILDVSLYSLFHWQVILRFHSYRVKATSRAVHCMPSS